MPANAIRFDLKPPRSTAADASIQAVELRLWQPGDRAAVATVIGDALAEYGLAWEPEGADRDAIEVEACYTEGEFWVVELISESADSDHSSDRAIVGTGAFYPVDRGVAACEIRKMYLAPAVRGRGFGRLLLHWLEQRALARGWQIAWIETASVLVEAVALYESTGYRPATGVETARCDRVYYKTLRPPLVPLDRRRIMTDNDRRRFR